VCSGHIAALNDFSPDWHGPILVINQSQPIDIHLVHASILTALVALDRSQSGTIFGCWEILFIDVGMWLLLVNEWKVQFTSNASAKVVQKTPKLQRYNVVIVRMLKT
jgi:hypothetical protein